MPYPQKGAVYSDNYQPPWVDRMKDAETGVTTPFKQSDFPEHDNLMNSLNNISRDNRLGYRRLIDRDMQQVEDISNKVPRRGDK